MVKTIPKIIHFCWFGPPMPDWVKRNIAEFRRLNPGYEVRVHGEEVLLPEYAATYALLEDICTKSDVLAVSALQRYGGWAFDTDYWPFRSVDAIVEAYQVAPPHIGGRMFLTEQHGHMNPRLRIANGILAAARDWPGWPLVAGPILSARAPVGRCDFGPRLFTRLVDEHPSLFVVGAWPWFYPAEIGRAVRLYPACVAGGARFAKRFAPTGGQLPFVMHLWAGGRIDLNPGKDTSLLGRLDGNPHGSWFGQRACLALHDIQWADASQAFRAVGEGLARIGLAVEVRAVTDEQALDTVDLALTWNGQREPYVKAVQKARQLGVPMLMFEHGFFDRRRYWQMDHGGILHWASWIKDLARPAPAEGAERLARVWPRPIEPPRKRKGYVLVLGQVRGDSQLVDSEIDVPTPLTRAVARSLPPGIEGRFRRHPLAQVNRVSYLPDCEAATLEEAVEGARFAVTINSNAGNECLAMGCPVLCLGPSVYGAAGVARTTSLATFKREFDEMIDGWRPDADRVQNYLHWLACRQWNADEFREGTVLDALIRKAEGRQ